MARLTTAIATKGVVSKIPPSERPVFFFPQYAGFLLVSGVAKNIINMLFILYKFGNGRSGLCGT